MPSSASKPGPWRDDATPQNGRNLYASRRRHGEELVGGKGTVSCAKFVTFRSKGDVNNRRE